MKKVFLFVFLTSVLFAAMGDDSLELANNYKKDGDYMNAVKYYEFAANEGNAQAQYLIGDIYFHGRYNSRIDQPQAVYYFNLSAEQNYQFALVMLGKLYFDGNKTARIKKNYKTAKNYFDRANNLYSDKEAQYYLGLIYFKAYKVKKDTEKAKNLFLESCDQEYLPSCKLLEEEYKIVMYK